MSLNDTLTKLGMNEDDLKNMLYVYQGTNLDDAKDTQDTRDWEELNDDEKFAWFGVYMYVKDNIKIDIDDHDKAINKQIKQAMRNKHGYLGLVHLNPSSQPTMLHTAFEEELDPTGFLYFWEKLGQELGEKIYGKKIKESVKKFERRNADDVEFDGLTKIHWNQWDLDKTLPKLEKDKGGYWSRKVLVFDQYGNAEVGEFYKSGKKTKRVKWCGIQIPRPIYWCDITAAIPVPLKEKTIENS